MATNIINEGKVLNLALASKTANDLIVVGDIVGIALNDTDADGYVRVLVGGCVTKISCKAIDGSGNSAIAVGDKLYYVSGDTPPVSKKNTGVHIGWALEAVTSGSTATIKVLLRSL